MLTGVLSALLSDIISIVVAKLLPLLVDLLDFVSTAVLGFEVFTLAGESLMSPKSGS